MHWRKKWQPTPVFLPGVSQGQGSLVGCHLWGGTESDTTEATQQQQQQQQSPLEEGSSPWLLYRPPYPCTRQKSLSLLRVVLEIPGKLTHPGASQNQGKRGTPYKGTRSTSFSTLVHQSHTVSLSYREKRIQRSGTLEQRIRSIKVKLVRRNQIILSVYMCWVLY